MTIGDPQSGSTANASVNNHKKLLNGALVIWDTTRETLIKLCCCGLRGNTTSRQFLWMVFKQNAGITVGYFLVYLAFGMCVGFMGPTLEDLACLTQQTVSVVSWAFFAQTCFMVVGILVAGLISKWLAADFLLLISISLLPVTLLVVSFSKRLDLLAITMSVMGLAMGVIDCLANLQLVNIYDKAVAPFLQAMHFCYGIGALISPIIAQNFLLNKDCSLLVGSKEFVDTNFTLSSGAELSPKEVDDDLNSAQQSTKVYQAFWIIAAIQVPIVIYMVLVTARIGLRVRNVTPQFQRLVNMESKPILTKLDEKEKSKAEKMKLQAQWQRYLEDFQGSYSISFSKAMLLTLAACVMLFIYDGLQGHVNEFVQTYAAKIVKLEEEKSNAGFLNAFFWAAYSAGRLISVYLAVKLTPYFMLLINIIGCQSAVFMFLSSVGGESFRTIAAANVVLGLFMSSITPTTISMMEHFMDMSNLQMSLIIGGAALGEMCIPIIEGQLIDDEPSSFVTLMLVMVALSWLVYAIFWLMGRVTQKYKAIASPSFIWYNPQHMEGGNSSTFSDLDSHEYKNATCSYAESHSDADHTELTNSNVIEDEKVDTREKTIHVHQNFCSDE